MKVQKGERLLDKENDLYGQLIMSLVEIVLNNKKFKWQDQDIKDDCRLEMTEDILINVPKTFDRTKRKGLFIRI